MIQMSREKIRRKIESVIHQLNRAYLGMAPSSTWRKVVIQQRDKLTEALRLLDAEAPVSQEPVAWMSEDGGVLPAADLEHFRKNHRPLLKYIIPLYTHPAPVSYSMSRDYEALYEHLKAGGEALGYVTFVRSNGAPSRRVMEARPMPNGTTLVTGGDVYETLSLHPKAFASECASLNLEWISPVAPAKTVSLERIMEVTETWYRSKPHPPADGNPYHRYIAERMDDLRSRLSSLLDHKKEQDDLGTSL